MDAGIEPAESQGSLRLVDLALSSDRLAEHLAGEVADGSKVDHDPNVTSWRIMGLTRGNSFHETFRAGYDGCEVHFS